MHVSHYAFFLSVQDWNTNMNGLVCLSLSLYVCLLVMFQPRNVLIDFYKSLHEYYVVVGHLRFVSHNFLPLAVATWNMH
jgi:hypothetical protein